MSTLVRRDQFNITPHGIVHKPTDTTFAPRNDDPYSGIVGLGQLRNHLGYGSGFNPDDVERIMRKLWSEYVMRNQKLFQR
jgi:hypothetical protein